MLQIGLSLGAITVSTSGTVLALWHVDGVNIERLRDACIARELLLPGRRALDALMTSRMRSLSGRPARADATDCTLDTSAHHGEPLARHACCCITCDSYAFLLLRALCRSASRSLKPCERP